MLHPQLVQSPAWDQHEQGFILIYLIRVGDTRVVRYRQRGSVVMKRVERVLDMIGGFVG